jgi:hypothetical protein
MSAERKPPRRLYKYRGFSDRTLNMLVSDQFYFADPSTFNDPLDTRPTLVTDLEADQLETILQDLVQRRVRAEMTAAARTLKYSGLRTIAHIDDKSLRQATELISDARYHATNPDFDGFDGLKITLGQHIQVELLRRYERGIVSLAERATCPLMWSHYGDQHRGICIGYSVPASVETSLLKIRYGGSRRVPTSLVDRMLQDEEGAEEDLDAAVLGIKAASWKYEREWRLIDKRGLRDSPLELEEVIFGIRCEVAVKYTVARALLERRRPIKLYEMVELPGTFHLKKVRLDLDEMFAQLPRRARDLFDDFEDLDLETGVDAS